MFYGLSQNINDDDHYNTGNIQAKGVERQDRKGSS